MAHESPLKTSTAASGKTDSYDEKARILFAILGRSRVEELRAKGLDLPAPEGGDTASEPQDVAKMRGQAADLLRLAARAQAKKSGSKPQVKNSVKGQQGKASSLPQPVDLSSRLLVHLDDLSLQEEHPAVIAHLLKSQGPKMRAKLLRMLPGRQARAAMRILRQGKAG